jgi:pimeloyl-ACP methyl ester carboxylesterase
VPVVLLHGTGASLEDYDYGVFRSLAAQVQVVAIDRTGHGYSGRPRGSCGAPVEQARIVRQILIGLGIDQAILVGHSWAGALVLAYALEYPSATLGVVLLQGTVYPHASVTSVALKVLALPWIGFWLAHLAMPWGGRRAIQAALGRAFAPDPIPPGYLARARCMWTRPGQSRAIAIDTRQRAATIAALSLRYPKIVVPVWMVVGTGDQFIDPAGQALRMRKELPDARLILLDGAGHQIPQTRPQAVVDAVLGLMEALRPTRGD